jgi:hypothetical protein
VISALAPVIPTIAGNNMAVREVPERIVTEAAYTALALAAAQARSSFVDLMAAWEKFAIFRRRRRSFTITDGDLASSRANRGGRSGSRHVVGGEEDDVRGEGEKQKQRDKRVRAEQAKSVAKRRER